MIEYSIKLQVFLNRLYNSVSMFQMHFASLVKGDRVRWLNLINWVVVLHQMVVYQVTCALAYRKLDWRSTNWDIYIISVITGYQSEVEYTDQQQGRSCYAAENHCRCGQVCKDFWRLGTVVLIVLVEYGARILPITRKLGVRWFFLLFNP